VIDARNLLGQTVRLMQSHSTWPLQRAEVTLRPDIIDGIIRQVMLDSSNSAIISKSVDRLLYQNAIRFALRLVVDMASSFRLSTFGLKFSLDVKIDPGNMLKEGIDTRSPMDVAAAREKMIARRFGGAQQSRTGGKGSFRRKKKTVHKTATSDDKKIGKHIEETRSNQHPRHRGGQPVYVRW